MWTRKELSALQPLELKGLAREHGIDDSPSFLIDKLLSWGKDFLDARSQVGDLISRLSSSASRPLDAESTTSTSSVSSLAVNFAVFVAFVTFD